MVLELSVATSLRSQEPTILLQEAKDLGYFHASSIHGPTEGVSIQQSLERHTASAWPNE